MKFTKIIKHNVKPFLLLFLVLIITSIWAFGIGEISISSFNLLKENFLKHFFSWDAWDKWMTVLTFVVAGFIGWQGYVRRWENSLPNKITVHFMYDDNCIMSCYRLYLSSESETRTWGQQIGKQMNDNNFLDFKPNIAQEAMNIVGNSFKHYEITFFLEKEPTVFKSKAFKDKYLVWILKDNGFVKLVHNRQGTPLSLEQAIHGGEELQES